MAETKLQQNKLLKICLSFIGISAIPCALFFFVGPKWTLLTSILLCFIAISFTVFIKISQNLIPFIPIIILFSPYLPGGIRSDFLVVIIFTIFTGINYYHEKGTLHVAKIAIYLLGIPSLTLLSTALFQLITKADYDVATTMLQYWPRVTCLSLIAFWAANNYTINDGIKHIKYLYVSLIIVALLGALETLRLLPEQYNEIMKLFLPSSSSFMRETLLAHSYRRATSFMSHPSVYGYLVLFTLWFSLRNKHNVIKILPRRILILFLTFCALLAASKVVYMGLIIIFISELYTSNKKFYLFAALGIITTTLFIIYQLGGNEGWGGSFPHIFRYFVDSMINKGLYEVLFKSRFDNNTGLLLNSLSTIKNNLLWGIGLNMPRNLFSGDSALVSAILRLGLIGGGYFFIVIIIVIKMAFNSLVQNNNALISSFLNICGNMLIFSFIAGIGIESFNLFKISEIIYFSIFYLYFGQHQVQNLLTSKTTMRNTLTEAMDRK